MKQPPVSPYIKTLGMIYFARMLDKVRKNARGELRDDFLENMGKGFDLRCATFLRVPYEDIAAKALEEDDDEALLRWCFDNGRALDENDLFLWNAAIRNRGFQDDATELLLRRKKESGFEDRDEIQTMLQYMEADEGRTPDSTSR